MFCPMIKEECVGNKCEWYFNHQIGEVGTCGIRLLAFPTKWIATEMIGDGN